ncbi:MAG: ABC transporter substrate-binding protein [Methanothrix sp.]|nr:ABC transporter substrate-binding protein [Methanothrix sp.]
MGRHKNIMILTTMLLLLGIIIAPCMGAESENGSNQGHIPKLVIGTTMDVNDINLGDFSFRTFTSNLIWPRLVQVDSQGLFVGDVAESWETDDAQTWTIHLAKNATWEDGKQITSGDVKFATQYLAEKVPSFAKSWENVESIETPDDYTVIFKFKSPNRNSLYKLQMMIIPQHIFKDIDDPLVFNDNRAVIGSGPYKFEKFDKKAGIISFKLNKNYWREKPVIDEVELKLYKNLDVMLMALQKGEIDVPYIYPAGVPYFHLSSLLKNSNLKCNISGNMAVSKVLWINNDRKPYDNLQLRKALSYAIDYEELVRLMTGGFGEVPNAGFIPKMAPYYIETEAMARDINESKSLLDSLGFKDINGDGFREDADGKEFVVKITVGPEDQASDSYRTAQLIKKYLSDVDLNVELKYMDENPFYEMMDTTKEFDIFIGGAGSWLFADYAGYWTGAFDYRSWGWAMVKDQDYLAMVDDLMTETKEDKVAEIVEKMQQYYASNMPAIPLYTVDYIQPYNKKYEGWGNQYVYRLMCWDTFYNLREVE